MRTDKERQAEIKAMTTEELQRKYDAGSFGPIRPFVLAELNARKAAEESAHSKRAEDRDDESLSISRKALDNSRFATKIAISAIVLSIIMAILEIIKWYSRS